MTRIRHSWIPFCGAATALALLCSGCNPPAKDPRQSPSPSPPAKADPAKTEPEKKTAETPPAANPQEAKVSLQAVDVTAFQRILGMQKGKVVLVDYWATWCEPCKELFPHTMEVARKFPGKDLAVVTMSFDDSTTEDKDTALKFLQKHQAATINLISSLDTADSFDAFKIEGGAIPFFQLYDRTGKLRHTFKVSPDTGPIEPEKIDLAIKELILEAETPAEKK